MTLTHLLSLFPLQSLRILLQSNAMTQLDCKMECFPSLAFSLSVSKFTRYQIQVPLSLWSYSSTTSYKNFVSPEFHEALCFEEILDKQLFLCLSHRYLCSINISQTPFCISTIPGILQTANKYFLTIISSTKKSLDYLMEGKHVNNRELLSRRTMKF